MTYEQITEEAILAYEGNASRFIEDQIRVAEEYIEVLKKASNACKNADSMPDALRDLGIGAGVMMAKHGILLHWLGEQGYTTNRGWEEGMAQVGQRLKMWKERNEESGNA